MVAFYSRGALLITFISSKLNNNDLVCWSDTHLLLFLRIFRLKKRTFQLNNAIIHITSNTSQWFSANHIQVFKRFAISSDMKSLKILLWGILVREVYANNKQFNSTGEIKAAILNSWSKTDAKTTSDLVHSINIHILQLI